MLSNVLTRELKIAEEEVTRAEGRFLSLAAGRISRLMWRAALYDPAQLVAYQARIADLIVLGPASRPLEPRLRV
jgi:hypothetical protein